MTATTVAHTSSHVFGADETISGDLERVSHCVDIHGPADLVADLHEQVGVDDLHADEGIVGDLDELGILGRGTVEGLVVDGSIELFGDDSRFVIDDAKEHELWVEEVAHGRAHGDEEWIVAELNVLVDHRQDALVDGAREDSRNDDYRAIFADLGDGIRELADALDEIVIVEIDALVGEPAYTLEFLLVRRLDGHEDDVLGMFDDLMERAETDGAFLEDGVEGRDAVRTRLAIGDMFFLHALGIDIVAHDVMAFPGDGDCAGEAELAEADEADLHGR